MEKCDSKIAVILGAPNSDDGTLSLIAESRCQKAASLFNSDNNYQFILTGGFGEHFNKSKLPHHSYQKQCLLSHGVKTTSIIAGLDTTNTVDDIKQAMQFCAENNIQEIIIITSDFHIPRVKILFDKYNTSNLILKNIEPSITNEDISTMLRLVEHEYRAIRVLNGDSYS